MKKFLIGLAAITTVPWLVLLGVYLIVISARGLMNYPLLAGILIFAIGLAAFLYRRGQLRRKRLFAYHDSLANWDPVNGRQDR